MKQDEAQAQIYEREAEAYHRLVSAEDVDGHLGEALAACFTIRGAAVIDVGAGTGRVSRVLIDRGARVTAVERAAPMLAVARVALMRNETCFVRADARALPLPSGSADAVVAGWVFGHFRLWMPDGWREEIGRAIAEAKRVVRAGGTFVIIETLGTGRLEGAPPSASLAEYYGWLESEHRMHRTMITTDYQFDTAEDAASCLGGFFGDAMRERILENGWARVPEFTGVWSTQIS